MSDFLIDTQTDDIQVINGNLSLSEGDEATRQRLQLKLNLFKNEWFLDRDIGTDYYGQILGNKNLIEANAEFVRAIITTKGIARITTPLSFNTFNRKMEVTFEAQLSSGTVETFTV